MKKYLLLFSLAAFLFACNTPVQEEKTEIVEETEIVEPEPVKDGIFIHISNGANDPHRLLMGLNMAVKMMEDKDVALYLDIEAVKVVKKEAEAVTYEGFPPSNELLAKLIDNNIIIMACPGCMKVAGMTEEDLMEGVMVADKEKFFNFTEGRIVSIDY
jgi:predicted peroxiredoxin